MRVHFAELRDHCAGLLAGAGISAPAAHTAAGLVLDADLRGLRSHGVAMLPSYLDGLKAGGISCLVEPSVVADTGALVILDGRNGLGHLTSAYAVKQAAIRARRTGIAAVGVRNAGHFGAASTWSVRLAEAGLVGIVLANSTPVMAAPGGCRAVVGTNPISIAAADSTGRAVVADLASSVGSVAKIRSALRDGAAVPDGWALDDSGVETTDPARALAGTLMPIGGAKGFALALMIDVLTGVLTGGGFGSDVSSFVRRPAAPNNCAHLFIAVASTVAAGVDALIEQVVASGEDVRAPGQWRSDLAAAQRRTGLEVSEDVLRRLGFAGEVW
ncbi:Ldh family oxidoreductase [Kutzneria sp. NPDC052558]|uniref:Ldh family oxidoreductase n=1 Tax=Kutzneria sp. NPDC052558 TaxID=3364121 RepID=UPI0037CAFE60